VIAAVAVPLVRVYNFTESPSISAAKSAGDTDNSLGTVCCDDCSCGEWQAINPTAAAPRAKSWVVFVFIIIYFKMVKIGQSPDKVIRKVAFHPKRRCNP